VPADASALVVASKRARKQPDGGAGYQPQPYQAEPEDTVMCPNCRLYNDPDAKYCDQCGFDLQGAGYTPEPYTREPGAVRQRLAARMQGIGESLTDCEQVGNLAIDLQHHIAHPLLEEVRPLCLPRREAQNLLDFDELNPSRCAVLTARSKSTISSV
jgi:hypothetical protein